VVGLGWVVVVVAVAAAVLVVLVVVVIVAVSETIPFHLNMANYPWRHHRRAYGFDCPFICGEVH
jgi:hypothetical protein